MFLFSFLAVQWGIARPHESAGWKTVYGVSILCGIGFTMSIFIGSLAFEPDALGESVDASASWRVRSFPPKWDILR